MCELNDHLVLMVRFISIFICRWFQIGYLLRHFNCFQDHDQLDLLCFNLDLDILGWEHVHELFPERDDGVRGVFCRDVPVTTVNMTHTGNVHMISKYEVEL